MARQTFNTFVIEGNIGRDAEVKTIGQQNMQCVTFSIAANMARNGTQQENVVWFQCNMFRNVKLAEYLKKGCRVLVNGQLEINPGQEGKIYYAIAVDRVQILSRPDNQNQQPQQNNQQAPNNRAAAPSGPIQGNFDPFSNI
jgi:single stranded DNA-binding protein